MANFGLPFSRGANARREWGYCPGSCSRIDPESSDLVDPTIRSQPRASQLSATPCSERVCCCEPARISVRLAEESATRSPGMHLCCRGPLGCRFFTRSCDFLFGGGGLPAETALLLLAAAFRNGRICTKPMALRWSIYELGRFSISNPLEWQVIHVLPRAFPCNRLLCFSC